jgi:hypothetical protein
VNVRPAQDLLVPPRVRTIGFVLHVASLPASNRTAHAAVVKQSD